MSEYWKSTPKYWCKSCSMYVRDTKLERSNHEATGKHQGAIKRQLRELHRAHEQGEREKDRAKREVERLNGVVSGQPPLSGTKRTAGASSAPTPASRQASQAERQRQLEQLADLGVSIPTELRPDMAMAGDWTVTTTRVVKETVVDEQGGEMEDKTAAATAIGMKRDRERTEDEKDAEELESAFDKLRKKPKRWGRGEEQDEDLDALLDEPLAWPKREAGEVKDAKAEDEARDEGEPTVKSELSEDGLGVPAKTELSDLGSNDKTDIKPPTTMFKKRKTKGSRQA